MDAQIKVVGRRQNETDSQKQRTNTYLENRAITEKDKDSDINNKQFSGDELTSNG